MNGAYSAPLEFGFQELCGSFREELYCSHTSLSGQQIRLQGRTLFPHKLFGAVINKGLMPRSGKNFIVREHLRVVGAK
jgi:hypothetical protein